MQTETETKLTFQLPLTRHPKDSYRDGWGAFFLTKSGKFMISAQGSSMNYSSPRKGCDKPEDYKSLEIAIFNADTREWATREELAETDAFDILGYGVYGSPSDIASEDSFYLGSNGVFGWVSIADIRELWSRI
jgi:hypothetical protein